MVERKNRKGRMNTRDRRTKGGKITGNYVQILLLT
jgi:hypothetical protein